MVSTRSISSSKIIEAPFHQVLAVLHDHPQTIELNPLVIKWEVSPTDPNFYTVTDKLVLLGLIPTQTKYTAQFVNHEDGIEIDITASGAVKLHNRWKLRSLEGGAWTEVQEDVTVKAHPIFMVFIALTLKTSHATFLERMAAKIEGREPKEHRRLPEALMYLAYLFFIAPPVIRNFMFPNASLFTIGMVSFTTSLSMRAFRIFLFPSDGTDNTSLGFSSRGLLKDAVWTVLPLVPHYILPGIKDNVIVSAVVLVVAIAVITWNTARVVLAREPYRPFHLDLNKSSLPDEKVQKPTEWINMGYWKETASFPRACESLALRLIRAADPRVGGNVLDVGYGAGESLLLHLSHPQVPLPTQLTGITSLNEHHMRSRIKVDEFLNTDPESKYIPVRLYKGDAVFRPSDIDHPLDPSSTASPFSTILALDCAYHFDDRRTFLQQSFTRLAPGGSIALADICFSPSSLRTPRTRWTTFILPLMPRNNVVSTEQYVHDMEKIGYVDITVEDITDNVFPGFIQFLKQRGWGWRVFSSLVQLYVGIGVRYLIVKGSKGKS